MVQKVTGSSKEIELGVVAPGGTDRVSGWAGEGAKGETKVTKDGESELSETNH